MPTTQHGLNWFSKQLIEILPAAVYVCNADAVIVAYNKRAAELWGRTPAAEQIDEHFCGAHKLYTADGIYMPHAESPMERVLRTGEPAHDLEVVIEQPNGKRIPVLVNISPIFDEAGVQTGAVNCFQDLSSQRHSEQDREKLTDNLRQSQKMEAVGQLTGGLAHDFNNLLMGISGNLELLQHRIRKGQFTDLMRYVNAAQGAAERAAAVTHRLLAFSRRQTLEAKPIDANRLIGGMEGLIRQTVGPGIAVAVVEEQSLWSILVDPNQLENALLNLAINARDAMPDGGLLTLETSNRSFDPLAGKKLDIAPGQYVSISVSDNGVGMTPDVLARAFEPFYTTKPMGAGTGLGLSMIYGFARQSGGVVRIHSEAGKGTAISIYLPRQDSVEAAAELPPERVRSPQPEQGTTVLLVDDEPDIRLLVAEVLEDQGYTIIQGEDAAAGLKVLQSNTRIDLIITDVGLPNGLNGRQLADAAREVRPDLKVLFITGYAENALIRHGHLAADMHIMVKPFGIEELAGKVSELIGGQAGR
jgi:PAS domain S-box-containing protein